MPRKAFSSPTVLRNQELDANPADEAGRPLERERAALADALTDATIPQSTIGRALRIAGNVVAEGMLRLDGVIEGDVQCGALEVGVLGRVMGNITADDVAVAGEVGGDIRGHKVTLRSGARVSGDIHHGQLAIHRGARFEGYSHPSGAKSGDGRKVT